MTAPSTTSTRLGYTLTATALLCLAAWQFQHRAYLLNPLTDIDQNGLLRLILCNLSALLILLVRTGPARLPTTGKLNVVPVVAVTGTLLAIIGIVYTINQLEWIGVLLIVGSTLSFGLGHARSTDVIKACVVLYFINPLPTIVFFTLQQTMQAISVNGAEWLLHASNTPAWADHFALHTRDTIFEVPSICSGMRGAFTVGVMSLCLGFIYRLTSLKTIIVVGLGLIQALILNVLRIALIAIFSPQTKGHVDISLLHDSTGALVGVALFLAFLNARWVRAWQTHEESHAHTDGSNVYATVKRAIITLPPFWVFVYQQRRQLISAALALLLVSFLTIKHRDHHRAQMIKRVALANASRGQLDIADRAAAHALSLDPEDTDFALERARILLQKHAYEATIQLVDTLSPSTATQRYERTIIEAYARLIGFDQRDQAQALMTDLPEELKHHPQVAMIRAELAMHADNVDDTVNQLLLASRWPQNRERVQRLYPYIARYAKWSVIRESDPQLHYYTPEAALTAATASMHLRDSASTARTLLLSLPKWPQDPRFLPALYFLARRFTSSEWEDRFERQLVQSAHRCSTQALYHQVNMTFDLQRPDLAWVNYHYLQASASDDPHSILSAARYADRWYQFRNHHLGLPADNNQSEVDLQLFITATQKTHPFSAMWGQIPLGQEVSDLNSPSRRAPLIRAKLAQFDTRPNDQPLTTQAVKDYAFLTHQLAPDTDPIVLLDSLTKRYPEHTDTARQVTAARYFEEKQWSSVYEILYNHTHLETTPLESYLLLGGAQLALHHGIGALVTARQAVKRFPTSTLATDLLSRALNQHNSSEEALFYLVQSSVYTPERFARQELKLLSQTQRFRAAEGRSSAALLAPTPISPDLHQATRYPPAEQSLNWKTWRLLSANTRSNAVAKLTANAGSQNSPYIGDLMALWLAAEESRCAAHTSRVNTWKAIGRNPLEQAIALNQLSLLLASHGHDAKAETVAKQAVALYPHSPELWRAWIGLGAPNPATCAHAHELFPLDPELWLAWLVTRLPSVDEAWYSEQARLADTRFSSTAQTRAAELMFRFGYKAPATIFLKSAVRDARSALPTYLLGIDCAVATSNTAWAITCSEQAIKASLKPTRALHKKLIAIAYSPTNNSVFVTASLEHLSSVEPSSNIWPHLLSIMQYNQGGQHILSAYLNATKALTLGATNRNAYLVAADAASRLGNPVSARKILAEGHAAHPRDLTVLNNLTYLNAQSTNSLSQAEQMIPRLLRTGGRSPEVIDTVIYTYIQSGDTATAQKLIRQEQARLGRDDAARTLTEIRAAQVQFKNGFFEDAYITLTNGVAISRSAPESTILYANQLLLEIERARRAMADNTRTVPSKP